MFNRLFALLTILTLARTSTGQVSSVAGPLGLDNAQCSTFTLTAHANSTNVAFNNVDQNYSNQTYVTQNVVEYALAPSNWTSQHINGSTFNLSKDYKINAKLCTPKTGAKANSNLIVASHGVGFDQSYWDFSLSTEYSFVKHAASYGYSVFTYDRLGCGKSDTPTNGFNEVQSTSEVSILQDLISQLKTTNNVGNQQWPNLVGLGHSFGSILSQAVSHNDPDAYNGLILTGFSTNSSGVIPFFLGASFTIPQMTGIAALANKPPTWLATGSIASLLTNFFSTVPNSFSDASLQLTRKTEQPVNLGVLYTQGNVGGVSQMKGPVQVVNGDGDLPFCSGNCYTSVNGKPIPEGVKNLHPAASNFSSYIAQNSGHGITSHFSQADTAEAIMSFIISNNL